MASVLTASNSVPLTVNEAFSGVWGMISLVSTIFLTIPQIVENYRSQSAAGISMLFLLIWFVGDVANLVGAVWAGLVPTVIGIAVYYCLSDCVLIGQCVYYNVRNARRERSKAKHRRSQQGASLPTGAGDEAVREEEVEEDADEEQPLLRRRTSTHSMGPPGSTTRRRSSAASRLTGNGHAEYGVLAKIIEGPGEDGKRSSRREWVMNTVGVVVIVIVGVIVWVVAWQVGAWKPTPAPEDRKPDPPGEIGKRRDGTPAGAEVLGYISATLYLGARIPQIWKNYKDKSCEGLSLLFFILSLLGNLTYGAQIFCHSLQKQYLIINVPWLIGSLGTMFEDIIIFVQFHIYGDKAADEEPAGDGAGRSDSTGSVAIRD